VAHACNPIYSGGRVRRIEIQSQPGQIVHKTLSQNALHKNRAGGVAQSEEGPDFKPQYRKNKQETKGCVVVVVIFFYSETESRYVTQASLKLEILLPQPRECWVYRRAHHAQIYIIILDMFYFFSTVFQLTMHMLLEKLLLIF
jgi:hypothetical protein